MGLAYKALGELEDALEYFKVVYSADESYKEAKEQIDLLTTK